ncbi:hypothetical protein FSP39_003644 [Pinctada imbricata]|uniref:Uncharacterized protein n=1 Tax=Pinctada imbricata TaxID=66713 RepID=A0AA89C520_PINIB|nr:hypothetical protein FSP39_003644 [Pinctada imbricata]
MEELAKLVVNQERRLCEIGSRIQKTDRTIDTFETTLHKSRVAENGRDYVQEAYLSEKYHESSMNEFFRNIDPENIEMYIEFCERVIEIDGKIKNENYKIEDLSTQIQESFSESNYGSNQDGSNETDSDLEKELSNLQAELNRIVSANMMQKYKAVEITKEIDACDKALQNKQNIIQDLQRQLEILENSESEAESFASALDYVNQPEESFTTSTPINNATTARTSSNHSAKLRTPASKSSRDDNQSDYVNIGAIMSWNDQDESEYAFVECKEFQHVTQVAKTTSAKKVSFDSEDSFSIDTDNTSNDSQFGGVSSKDKYLKPSLHHQAFSLLPGGKSLDNDELISERIRSEIYAFKSHRKCNDLSRSLTNMNGDRSFSCHKSVDDLDSNSDTGLSSMNSDDTPNFLETLV